MAVTIAGSAVVSCLGDGPATFAALLAGRSGVGRLRHLRPAEVGVDRAYQLADGTETALAAGALVERCVATAMAGAGLDATRVPTVALVGTGLRELRTVERWALGEIDGPAPDDLHFAAAVRRAVPAVGDVITLANACSAGGHALALAQDLLDAGAAGAVIVAAADTVTASMLAMIGRTSDPAPDHVRPFDAERPGVLLGEGAAALVLVPDQAVSGAVRVLATGLSCDAAHETAPDAAGIRRAMVDALDRAGRPATAVDLVIAHGTGTALNDPVELAAVADVLGPRPLITGLKGAVGHTSGSAPLLAVDVAVRCLRSGMVPPVVGLRRPLDPAAHLVHPSGRAAPVALAQVNSFGFGGVNAVTLLERAA